MILQQFILSFAIAARLTLNNLKKFKRNKLGKYGCLLVMMLDNQSQESLP
jgi:hypothetical protein